MEAGGAGGVQCCHGHGLRESKAREIRKFHDSRQECCRPIIAAEAVGASVEHRIHGPYGAGPGPSRRTFGAPNRVEMPSEREARAASRVTGNSEIVTPMAAIILTFSGPLSFRVEFDEFMDGCGKQVKVSRVFLPLPATAKSTCLSFLSRSINKVT